jgi:hypothetical protein
MTSTTTLTREGKPKEEFDDKQAPRTDFKTGQSVDPSAFVRRRHRAGSDVGPAPIACLCHAADGWGGFPRYAWQACTGRGTGWEPGPPPSTQQRGVANARSDLYGLR